MKYVTLTNHKYANARVAVCDDCRALVSYRTTIADLTNDGWLIPHYAPDCSRTTISHVGWFMREYCAPCTYHDLKRAYYGHYKINVFTGEIEEL